MSVTENRYTGDGSTVLFSFTFPYIDASDVKVSLNGTDTTAYSLANATTVEMDAAPALGQAVRVYRATDDSALAATFYPGSAIRAADLNDNLEQVLFISQEVKAQSESTEAAAIAGTAQNALDTANAASATAAAALNTANAAETTANGIASTASTALANSSAAVATADGIAATANTALSNSTAAVNAAAAALGFRNRIINGGMLIDQRNNGGAVTINASLLTYSVDRWAGFGMASAGVFTLNRSTTAPSGFAYSLAAVCTTADSTIAAGDRYLINQPIEGHNTADLGFGAAGAKTVTLSFWVQSSLTGTYCAALVNATSSRSYVAEYDINVADTWEYKTITITGDTSGTWLSDNGIGVVARFALATGTTYQTTANAWAAGNFNATSNQVNWMSSSSSRTFRITGVQLEPGPTATPFEQRPVGAELALCQRYYCRQMAQAQSASIGFMSTPVYFPVEMRAIPTRTNISPGSQVSAVASALTPSSATSAYFQIQATVSGGYILNRLDAYSAEL
jgi:hypothetical protein